MFSNMLSTALPFVLLPFLTTYLSQKDYGILSNFTGLTAFFIPVVTLNFVSAYSRQYYKKDVNIETYVSTGILFQTILSAATGLILFCIEDFIYRHTGIPVLYVRLIAVYSLIFGVTEVLLTSWRLEDKVWHFGLFRIIRSLLEVLLTIFFVVSIDTGVDGRIIAFLTSIFIGFIPVVIFLRKKKYLTFSFDSTHIDHILRYGVPLIPHAVAGTLLVYSDKMIITNEIGLDANGVYSVAFQVALIIGLIQNSFNQAWVPWFYKSLTNLTVNLKLKIVKITYIYYLALVGITLLLILGTPVIFMILGKEFAAGKELVSWIAVGFMFNGMYKMKVNYLFFKEKTVVIGLITIFAAILNIILNIILIEGYGLTGAAIATSITFLFQFIVVWVLAQKVFPMPWFNLSSFKQNDSI